VSNSTQGLLNGMTHSFGERFLQDYAGQIISNPRIAVVELIANAYDAGAGRVDIRWPSATTEEMSIADDGTGMTRSEFERRWQELSYNRLQEQGEEVQFPPGAKRRAHRIAFGRNGKGRLAAFCFADTYFIRTCKGGTCTIARVELAQGRNSAFHVTVESEEDSEDQGTKIWATAERRGIEADALTQIIGSQFLVDPSFDIKVNGRAVQLLDLENLETSSLDVEPFGQLTVYQIDGVDQTRTGRLRGITWWVNQRMVGDPSWDRLDDEGAYLDGRTEEAKRFSFVVAADFLKVDVKDDWSSFHATPQVNAAKKKLHSHIIRHIDGLLAGSRRKRKNEALQNHRLLLADLPILSKKVISRFVDEIQEKCPTLAPRDLSRAVEVLGNLERTRSGYDLLKQLADCSVEDLETWNRLMHQWSATGADIVLSELEGRLTLIGRMHRLVESSEADELHDLQPLFERGLWIFGPEFEAVDFRSNRSLAEVITRLLGGTEEPLPRRRPDFVALPDNSIGVYGADSYNDDGQISGLRKVLIVELKKGGFRLTQKEIDQARDYAKELRKGARIQPDTEIVGYVLGAVLEDGLEKAKHGERIVIHPMTYQTVLQRAHDRTFNLQRRIKEFQFGECDEQLDVVLRLDPQRDLFDDLESA